MNADPRQDLLHDVLVGSELAAADNASLEPMLAAVRRRRRQHRFRGNLITAALLTTGLASLWINWRSTPLATNAPATSPLALAVVNTSPLPPGMQIRSTAAPPVPKVFSLAGTDSVRTQPAEALFEPIDDEKLETLAGARAVLVHFGSDGAELVWVGTRVQ